MITLNIQGVPALPNRNMYSHWAIKRKEAKRWKELVVLHAAQLPERPTTPFKRAKLTLVRHSSRQPDHDNLVMSFKHCVDGLKLAGIILDDKPSVIVEAKYLWQKEKQKNARVTIMVEAA